MMRNMNVSHSSPSPTIAAGNDVRAEISVDLDGDKISVLHFPALTDALRGKAGAPAVILAHGYGFTRDCGLQPYAERFAAAGIHAFVFDYRGFGASGGRNREVVNAKRQIDDYLAVIDAVRGVEAVDPDRVALWGTSYSGGSVIAASALDGRIAAVIAQVPNLDNRETLKFLMRNTPPRRMAWLFGCVFRDVLNAALRREPFYVRANGRTGEAVAYDSDEAMDQIEQIAGPTWANRVGMRDFARVPLFRAIKFLPDVPCRVQFFTCELDDLTPAAPAHAAAKQLGDRAELHSYQAGHFGIYVEPFISQALAAQEEFLVKELRPSDGG